MNQTAHYCGFCGQCYTDENEHVCVSRIPDIWKRLTKLEAKVAKLEKELKK